jgi:VanZ family protein
VSRALRLWSPVAAWMAVIFAVSSMKVPARVAAIPDWSTHGSAYAVLSLLCCRALAGGIGGALRRRDAILAIVLCAAYGVTDELHQRLVPGRDAALADVAKDAAGAVAGAWLYRRVFVPRDSLHQREAHRG